MPNATMYIFGTISARIAAPSRVTALCHMALR
jgi:hypothetical protein